MYNLFKKLTLNTKNSQAGMTYAELIVVLSIFSIIATVIIFNYRGFQAKVDIKNLSNDIALQFVQAQKDSTSGRFPPASVGDDWKPSYGIYFDGSLISPGPLTWFEYFVDIDDSGTTFFDPDTTSCELEPSDECLDHITIGRGNFVQNIFYIESGQPADEAEAANNQVTGDVFITYQRPGTTASISCASCAAGTIGLRILLGSPEDKTGRVDVYESGRIKID